jgi:hypothetical protein
MCRATRHHCPATLTRNHGCNQHLWKGLHQMMTTRRTLLAGSVAAATGGWGVPTRGCCRTRSCNALPCRAWLAYGVVNWAGGRTWSVASTSAGLRWRPPPRYQTISPRPALRCLEHHPTPWDLRKLHLGRLGRSIHNAEDMGAGADVLQRRGSRRPTDGRPTSNASTSERSSHSTQVPPAGSQASGGWLARGTGAGSGVEEDRYSG